MQFKIRKRFIFCLKLMIRAANDFDKIFLSAEVKVQLVFHCKKEENVPKVLEKLRKLCLPLRVKYEDGAYFWNGEEPPVAHIPEDLKNLDDVARFVTIACNPLPKSSLAVLAANKNFVAANVSHACWDGRIMIDVADAIVNDIDVPEFNTFYNSINTFPEEIAKAEAYPESDVTHPGLTRFASKDKFFKAEHHDTQYCTIKTPAKDLKIYDPIAQKPRGLTDALYANICLACAAYEGKLDKIGLNSCVDLRKYIPYKYGWEHHNVFATIDVVAEGVTMDTTIRDVMRKTREYFNQRIKDGAQFGFFKHLTDKPDLSRQIKKYRPSLSNLGIFPIGGIVDDILAKDTCILDPKGYFGADFVSYGIRGLGRNDIFTVFEYSQMDLSRREAGLLLNSVDFGLRNLDLDLTCGQAMERLQEFQRNYIKNEYPKFSYQDKK